MTFFNKNEIFYKDINDLSEKNNYNLKDKKKEKKNC